MCLEVPLQIPRAPEAVSEDLWVRVILEECALPLTVQTTGIVLECTGAVTMLASAWPCPWPAQTMSW